MKQKTLFLFFICLSLYNRAQTLVHSELLGRPTDTEITIQVFFDSTVEVSAQYSTSSNTFNQQSTWQTIAANEPAEIVLNNLQPNTKYFYRLCYRKPNTANINYRPEYTFQTQRSKSAGFSFTVQADPHADEQTDTALYNLCLKNQLDDKPDFMIDLGDFLMTDKLSNAAKVVPRDTVTYRCHLLRRYYERLGHSVPLYIALGNHEGEAGWLNNKTANCIPVWGTLDRKKYFSNPAPNLFYDGDTTNYPFVGMRESYYAWTWGDALFIVLDPYWNTNLKPDSLNGWRWTLGKTQYNWLRSTLEKSNSKFKFVFAHQLIGGDPDGRGGVEFANLYEWGGNNLDGTRGFEANRPDWYKPIKDLLTEHRVNIFFHGHDHFFGKQEKNCLMYQEVPQPSHPNFTSIAQATGYGYKEGVILPGSGHLRVTVDGNGAKVDYVRAYLPKNETGLRKNKDVSATYYIGTVNCYDSLSTGSPVLWNSNYVNELVYPNPFNNQVRIEFTVPSTQIIHLAIYNDQGQLVKTLIDNHTVLRGSFEIIWDGKDYNNYILPNGNYYYQLTGENEFRSSNKIIIAR